MSSFVWNEISYTMSRSQNRDVEDCQKVRDTVKVKWKT